MSNDKEYIGHVMMSKSIVSLRDKLYYCVRLNPEQEGQTGWLFFSKKDLKKVKKGLMGPNEYEKVSFADLESKFQGGKYSALLALYHMPIPTYLTYVEDTIFSIRGNRKEICLQDDETRRYIYIEKYLTLPVGSPLKDAYYNALDSTGFARERKKYEKTLYKSK